MGKWPSEFQKDKQEQNFSSTPQHTLGLALALLSLGSRILVLRELQNWWGVGGIFLFLWLQQFPT